MKDITRTIGFDTLTYPGDRQVLIENVNSISRGDSWNEFQIHMSNHTGTHLDAPLHFIRNGKNLNQYKPDNFIFNCRVIEIKSKISIGVNDLKRCTIEKGEAVLFKTRNSGFSRKKFRKDFTYIGYDAAKYLVGKKVKLVGIDYLSIDPYEGNGFAVHKLFLNKDILILEDIDLRKIKPGKYRLYCFPLKLYNSNGAPARAFLE